MLEFAIELSFELLKLWNRKLRYIDWGLLEQAYNRLFLHTLAGAWLSLCRSHCVLQSP